MMASVQICGSIGIFCILLCYFRRDSELVWMVYYFRKLILKHKTFENRIQECVYYYYKFGYLLMWIEGRAFCCFLFCCGFGIALSYLGVRVKIPCYLHYSIANDYEKIFLICLFCNSILLFIREYKNNANWPVLLFKYFSNNFST